MTRVLELQIHCYKLYSKIVYILILEFFKGNCIKIYS